MVAVSVIFLLISNLWNSARDQAAEDRAQLKVQDKEISAVKSQVEKVQITVESLSKRSDARWGALLSSLPEVKRKIQEEESRETPVFEPEWHR